MIANRKGIGILVGIVLIAFQNSIAAEVHIDNLNNGSIKSPNYDEYFGKYDARTWKFVDGLNTSMFLTLHLSDMALMDNHGGSNYFCTADLKLNGQNICDFKTETCIILQHENTTCSRKDVILGSQCRETIWIFQSKGIVLKFRPKLWGTWPLYSQGKFKINYSFGVCENPHKEDEDLPHTTQAKTPPPSPNPTSEPSTPLSEPTDIRPQSTAPDQSPSPQSTAPSHSSTTPDKTSSTPKNLRISTERISSPISQSIPINVAFLVLFCFFAFLSMCLTIALVRKCQTPKQPMSEALTYSSHTPDTSQSAAQQNGTEQPQNEYTFAQTSPPTTSDSYTTVIPVGQRKGKSENDGNVAVASSEKEIAINPLYDM